ncbi:Histidine kinase-, DNA gyrase B-, and HSP90-like ATPase [Pseudomonas sp. LAMO17WK12:I10]|uniref:sensor histidine kinase n=1 Tax=unclassified Pseudomonas TaxID=196821 RepID=UPI000BCF32A1|nr:MULTISPECIES: ATP-binding protein [unclassified Pseudomonas]PXX51297.1 histidine kinase/DNA gyrase B/HSP90-like ATPase [Pseudomonas sp. LAMO17WK12:I9]SNY53890.1 Histidine kinase-, DNA gyrase B-, and HSP90-like ATPase [Pseudomonas sp. LAMO17WK12:I10]
MHKAKELVRTAVKITGRFRLTSKFLFGGAILAVLLLICTSYLLYSIANSVSLLEKETKSLELLQGQTNLWHSFLPTPNEAPVFKTIDKDFISKFSEAFNTKDDDLRPHHLAATIQRLNNLNENPSFEKDFITYLILSHSILERLQQESQHSHLISNKQISTNILLLYVYLPYILDNTARQLAILSARDPKLDHYIVGLEFIVLDGLRRVNQHLNNLENQHTVNTALYTQLTLYSDELERFQVKLSLGHHPSPPSIEKGITLLEELRIATLKEVDQQIARQNFLFILTLLALIALVIILALIATGTVLGITNALNAIETASRLFSSGQLDARIQTKSSDEFFKISDNFNKIAENFNRLLTQQRETSKIHQIALERQVQERTTELALANKELSMTIKTLNKTQDKIIEREKMAALGTLVAGVAHEVNTPIGLAYTAATHLQDKFNQFFLPQSLFLPQDADQFLSAMKNSLHYTISNLERAAVLIESFKQVAIDRSNDKPRPFNISKTLTEIARTLSPILRNGNHQIQIITPTAIYIESLPGAFGQVVTNIVLNAVTHAFEGTHGGTIKIEASMTEPDTLMMIISDDGKGMPPETCARVFDPFFTTKRGRGGSGLGLHISWNLITQSLRGTISCSSTVGVGSTFTLMLPKTLEEP